MRTAVAVYPGSNRNKDMITALTEIIGRAPSVCWHTDPDIPAVDLIVLPGGFSFGDYLRCGAIAGRSPLTRAVIERANAGVPVLGVCNGFQILTECGLLPGALMRNAGLTFVCREVRLRVDNTDSLFTTKFAPGQVMRCPVAHHDGNYFADEGTLATLNAEDRVAFRYCDPAGALTTDANPNGSRQSIAGILSSNRRVLGMMPHPENLIEPLHGGTDGRILFESVLASLAA